MKFSEWELSFKEKTAERIIFIKLIPSPGVSLVEPRHRSLLGPQSNIRQLRNPRQESANMNRD
jgi:hypothetical protein